MDKPDRSVVAISEDRQWAAILRSFGGFAFWSFEDRRVWPWKSLPERVKDTGQDAHEVLREFLEGRE